MSTGSRANPSISKGIQPALLSTRPAVTFLAKEHCCPVAGTKLHCLMTEEDKYEQVAQSCDAVLP